MQSKAPSGDAQVTTQTVIAAPQVLGLPWPSFARGYLHSFGTAPCCSPAPCGRGLGGGVRARQRARARQRKNRNYRLYLETRGMIAADLDGFMRACRRETPPPNPRPQGAGECTELFREMY